MWDDAAVENIAIEKLRAENIAIETAMSDPHPQLRLDTLKSDYGPVGLVWHAFLLNEEAHRYLVQQPATLMRGTICLFFLLLVLSISRIAGLMLNRLTSIRIEMLQDGLYNFATQTEWYAQNIAVAPKTVDALNRLYFFAWQVLRFVVGLPAWGGIFGSVLLTVVGVLLIWLTHGVIAHWLARWQGSRGNIGQTLGGLALALAPLIATVLAFLPGLTLAIGLIFLWIVLAQYQALKAAHGLTWPRTLIAAIGPYIIVGLLLLSVTLFGISAALPY